MHGGRRLVRKYFVINQNWRLVLRITDEIESTTNLFGVIVFYSGPIRYIYLIFSRSLSLFISMKYTVLLLCVFYERIYLFMLQFQLFVFHAFTIHLGWDEQLNHSKKQVTCASHIFSTIKRKQTMWKQMCALHIFSFCWQSMFAHNTINWRFLIFFILLVGVQVRFFIQQYISPSKSSQSFSHVLFSNGSALNSKIYNLFLLWSLN